MYICGKDLKGIKDVSMHKPKLKKVHSLFLSPLFSTFFYNCKYFFLLSPGNSIQVLASEPVIFLVWLDYIVHTCIVELVLIKNLLT